MISFNKTDNTLELHYDSVTGENSWIEDRLKETGEVRVHKTFTFRIKDLVPAHEQALDDTRVFVLGFAENDYYHIEGRVLGLKHDLYLYVGMAINEATFLNHQVSIFKKIDELVDEVIVIAGPREDAIPLPDFRLLQKNFPSKTELRHYAAVRISRILKDYFNTMTDARQTLEHYLELKEPVTAASPVSALKEYEIEKWVYVRDQIRMMLSQSDAYSEKQWQRQILEFILLLFPKYIKVIENFQIKDFYTSAPVTKDRYIDLTLIDADGHIDVIEIKKPFAKALLSTSTYRDSYTPKKELSGAVMQVEKYLFHLNKWGVAGEAALNKKYSAELPAGLALQIINPKAFVILGRDDQFSKQEKFDFEIIRRKYANVIDILTYDDLLRRLGNIIIKLRA